MSLDDKLNEIQTPQEAASFKDNEILKGAIVGGLSITGIAGVSGFLAGMALGGVIGMGFEDQYAGAAIGGSVGAWTGAITAEVGTFIYAIKKFYNAYRANGRKRILEQQYTPAAPPKEMPKAPSSGQYTKS